MDGRYNEIKNVKISKKQKIKEINKNMVFLNSSKKDDLF
jgi:hypothetical protein